MQRRKLEKDDDQLAPIVIFDGDNTESSMRRSTFKSSMKKRSVLVENPQPKKSYSMKFQVIKVKCHEAIDETTNLDISKYYLINLKSIPFFNFERPPGYELYLQSHSCKQISDLMDNKHFLIDLLSRRQTRILYSTNQDMHLKNNLSQLVDGEQ